MEPLNFKVCGMKLNTEEVAELAPNYLGFIFYPPSPRFFNGTIPELPASIKKVGVFVNADIKEVMGKIKRFDLDVIQLHGDETPEYCESLINTMAKSLQDGGSLLPIWKVFGVDTSFTFDPLYAYQDLVDAYLFDTKSDKYGGTGTSFNWKLLSNYPFKKPFILSGGIGLEQLPAIEAVRKLGVPMMAVDVNSQFEVEPGKKDLAKLVEFVLGLSAFKDRKDQQQFESTNL